ncbi:MAG: polysaccharide lyase 6 family protein [Lentisphaeria bacterium]|nr:polysaccharide lyase 6 family protein [Lentisphaeria bacterium]
MPQPMFKIVALMALWIAVIGSAGGREAPMPITVDSPDALESAVAKARPGAVIVLADGTYDQAVTLAGKGTAESPVVVRAQRVGGVKLKNTLTITGNHLAVIGFSFTDEGSVRIQGDGHRLSRCHIDNAVGRHWVHILAGSRQIEVDHCRFENKEINRASGRGGVVLKADVLNRKEQHHFHHNHFRNIPKGKGSNGYETVQVITKGNPFDPDSLPNAGDCETVIERNLFERCNGEAEIISNKANGNRIRGNTFVACRGSVVLRHGHRNIAEGNVFMGGDEKGSGGVRLQGRDQIVADNYFRGLGNWAVAMMDGTPDQLYVRVERAKILRNTIVDCGVGLSIGQNHSKHPNGTVPKDCLIENNLIVNPGNVAVQYVRGDVPEGWTWTGNVVKGAIGIPEMAGLVPGDPHLPPEEVPLSENDVGPLAGLEGEGDDDSL